MRFEKKVKEKKKQCVKRNIKSKKKGGKRKKERA